MAPTRDARGRFTSKNTGPTQMSVDLKQKAEKIAVAEAGVVAKISAAEPITSVKVEFGSNYHTAQIYSKGYEFAFMSLIEGIYKQCCTFVFCKDFLHDAVWAHINKKPWTVWDFKYTPGKDLPLDDNNCVLAFRNTLFKGKEAEFHSKREACQDLLNQIETVLGFQHSQIFEVPHPESPCWLIVGDKGWQHAAPMVGLFTLLIRVGIAHEKGRNFSETLKMAEEGKLTIGDQKGGYAGDNDCQYIKDARKGIDAILKHSLGIFYPTIQENYPEDLPKRGASLHDAYGPVSFTKHHAKKAMPHWFRDEVWK